MVVDPSLCDLSYKELRKAAVDFFMIGTEDKYPSRDEILTSFSLGLMAGSYDKRDARPGESVQEVVLRQYEDGRFVFYPFIQAMANILNCGIKIRTRDIEKPEIYNFTMFDSPFDSSGSDPKFLTLEHVNGNHFQSILPRDEVPDLAAAAEIDDDDHCTGSSNPHDCSLNQGLTVPNPSFLDWLSDPHHRGQKAIKTDMEFRIGEHFDHPIGVAVLRNGNIVVTSSQNEKVIIVTNQGWFLRSVQHGRQFQLS